MNLRKNRRNSPEAHTSALNDILFILLLFFLIISTLANPNVIKLSLPKAKSDTRAKQTVVISINPSQQFFVGTHPVQKDSLRSAIEPLLRKETDAEPTIVINADKTANAESIVDVMRVASALKVRAVLAIDQD